MPGIGGHLLEPGEIAIWTVVQSAGREEVVGGVREEASEAELHVGTGCAGAGAGGFGRWDARRWRAAEEKGWVARREGELKGLLLRHEGCRNPLLGGLSVGDGNCEVVGHGRWDRLGRERLPGEGDVRGEVSEA